MENKKKIWPEIEVSKDDQGIVTAKTYLRMKSPNNGKWYTCPHVIKSENIENAIKYLIKQVEIAKLFQIIDERGILTDVETGELIFKLDEDCQYSEYGRYYINDDNGIWFPKKDSIIPPYRNEKYPNAWDDEILAIWEEKYKGK